MPFNCLLIVIDGELVLPTEGMADAAEKVVAAVKAAA